MARSKVRGRPVALREFRILRGWTQAEAEDRAGLSRGYLTRLESGRTGGIRALRALAELYEVEFLDVADIVHEDHDNDGTNDGVEAAS